MPFASIARMLGNHRERTFIIAIFVFIGGLIFMMQGGSGIWWWDSLLNLGSAAVLGLLWDYLRRSGAPLLTGLFAWMALVTFWHCAAHFRHRSMVIDG